MSQEPPIFITPLRRLPPMAASIPNMAAALDISVSHLYALIAVGEIRVAKLGSRTVIPIAEAQRYLDSKIVERSRNAA